MTRSTLAIIIVLTLVLLGFAKPSSSDRVVSMKAKPQYLKENFIGIEWEGQVSRFSENFSLALGPRSAVRGEVVMPSGSEVLRSRIVFTINHDNRGGSDEDLKFAYNVMHGSATTGHWGWNREANAGTRLYLAGLRIVDDRGCQHQISRQLVEELKQDPVLGPALAIVLNKGFTVRAYNEGSAKEHGLYRFHEP